MKNGYYNKIELGNTPNSEKDLFRNAINHNFVNEDMIVGIEIGVLNGETSDFFLSTWRNLFLFGIDPFIPDSMDSSLIGNVEVVIELETKHRGRFVLMQDYSQNVISKFKDETYDFVFIDGSHVFEDVKRDYELYEKKIKSGGLIFFHDSRMNRGGANFHKGSSDFVDFIIENDKGIDLIGEAFSLTCFKKK